ncbi:MAG: plasmid mobilization relaxosome protein MobC [Oscillospiraceae bacterium]|nr:plasmid mobilization relaxosome protein MobC [Oscillospiraceae bacterium]
MRKTKQIKRKEIIFEPDEWARIEAKATKVNLKTSKYIRRMVLNGQIIQMDVPGIAPLVNAMRTINNNVNQVARKANETHSIYAEDIEILKGGLSEIC